MFTSRDWRAPTCRPTSSARSPNTLSSRLRAAVKRARKSAGRLGELALLLSELAWLLSEMAWLLSESAWLLSEMAWLLSEMAWLLSESAWLLSEIAWLLSEIALLFSEIALRLSEIALRLSEIALRLGEIALRLGEIALRLGEIALRLGEIALRLSEIALRLGEIALRLGALDWMLVQPGSMSVAPVSTRRAPVLPFFLLAERTVVIAVHTTSFRWRFVTARFLPAPPASRSSGLGAGVPPRDWRLGTRHSPLAARSRRWWTHASQLDPSTYIGLKNANSDECPDGQLLSASQAFNGIGQKEEGGPCGPPRLYTTTLVMSTSPGVSRRASTQRTVNSTRSVTGKLALASVATAT